MADTPGWPAVLSDGPVRMRGLRSRDGAAWVRVRKDNVGWLAPWEATPPEGPNRVPTSMATFLTMARRLGRDARRGLCFPFGIFFDDALVGQLTVGGITRGSLQSAHLGYWVDQRVAGRGIMPTAVALATDHAFMTGGLHRIEVNIRPENVASRRVMEKLGFREEGLRPAFLHIAGEWRDHLTFALTREEVAGGLLARWHRRQRTS